MSETPRTTRRIRRIPIGPTTQDKTETARTSARAGATSRTARSTAQARRRSAPARSGPSPIFLGGIIGLLIVGLLLVLFLIVTKNNPLVTAAVPTQTSQLTQAPGANATVPSKVIDNATPAGIFDGGAGGPNKGQFDKPRGIAIDKDGNYFVSDDQNLRIQKFDKTGKFVTAFGSKGDADGQFNPINDEGIGTGPSGIATDKDGNVYVADTWNHRIQKFDNNGKFLAKWGGFVNTADAAGAADKDKNTKFYGPRGVAMGPDGNLYVTDTGNKRVLIFDTTGKFVREISSGQAPDKKGPEYPFNKPGEMNEPIGIAVDKDGNVYVADTRNSRIQKFDKAGKPAAQWAVPATNWAPGPYLEPFVSLDSAGNLYATAPTGHSVLKFAPDGKVAGEIKEANKVALKTPTGIVVGADGTVYVVDADANAVLNLGKIP